MFRIPLARPEITDADRNAVLEVLSTTQLSMGPKLAEFEDAICTHTGSPFAVAMNSGTSALHLAFRALNVPKGAEVILPSFGFGATLNVLLQEGLQPVFIDIDAHTLNTTPELVEAAITPRTKAILAVHTFGRPVAVDQLRTLADRRNLFLIEDACEAIGAEIGGEKAGTYGDAGTLAFYPNKQITTGEGGALLTPCHDMAARARILRNQGRDPGLDWFQHVEVGFSYRLADINCALGTEQLRRVDDVLARRENLAALYDSKLENVPGIERPSLSVENGRISWFCYVVQITTASGRSVRDYVSEQLAKRGIATGRYFAPLHLQPVIAQDHSTAQLPVTEEVAQRVLALPFFNQLTEAEVSEVCASLREVLAEAGRKT